jgi:hypothetical protein
MVVGVGFNAIAAPVHRDFRGPIEMSNGPFAVSMAANTNARQCGHLALWCDLANTSAVSHKDVAVLIHCDSLGKVEIRMVPFSVLMDYCGHRVAVHPAFHNDYNITNYCYVLLAHNK